MIDPNELSNRVANAATLPALVAAVSNPSLAVFMDAYVLHSVLMRALRLRSLGQKLSADELMQLCAKFHTAIALPHIARAFTPKDVANIAFTLGNLGHVTPTLGAALCKLAARALPHMTPHVRGLL